jgi:hypothetical protein
LLDRDHLALHLGKLGRRLLVAADKEGRRPEDDDGRRGDQVTRPSLVRCLSCEPDSVAALVDMA